MLPPVTAPDLQDSLRVLVVDDNPDATQVLQWALQDLGDEVHISHDGLEALRMAYDVEPDVILLDLGLPGLDGFQVCQSLRNDPRTSGIKIIAVTGQGEPEHKRMTAAAGFDLHLVKPVDLLVLSDMFDLLRHGSGIRRTSAQGQP